MFKISSNQIAVSLTTDEIYDARSLMKKHPERRRPFYFAFVDLKKVFDRLLHKLI